MNCAGTKQGEAGQDRQGKEVLAAPQMNVIILPTLALYNGSFIPLTFLISVYNRSIYMLVSIEAFCIEDRRVMYSPSTHLLIIGKEVQMHRALFSFLDRGYKPVPMNY